MGRFSVLHTMRPTAWLAMITCLLGTLSLTQRSPARGEAEGHAVSRVTGQWIWTARDVQLFERTRARGARLSASLLVATVECSQGSVQLRRGLSPVRAGLQPRALLVRFDDSFSHCLGNDELKALDAVLEQLLVEIKATGASFAELQLDYDAPISKLPRYADLLGYLKARSLRGLELWVTSIPAHVQARGYGDLLRRHVTGHILQLFDTGLDCDVTGAETLRAALLAQRMPYRLGYGSFERAGAPVAKSHACWQELTASWQREPGAAGWWLFPAGIGYERSLARLESAR